MPLRHIFLSGEAPMSGVQVHRLPGDRGSDGGQGEGSGPPGRVSRNLASDGHVAPSGRFVGAAVEGAAHHVTSLSFPVCRNGRSGPRGPQVVCISHGSLAGGRCWVGKGAEAVPGLAGKRASVPQGEEGESGVPGSQFSLFSSSCFQLPSDTIDT